MKVPYKTPHIQLVFNMKSDKRNDIIRRHIQDPPNSLGPPNSHEPPSSHEPTNTHDSLNSPSHTIERSNTKTNRSQKASINMSKYVYI